MVCSFLFVVRPIGAAGLVDFGNSLKSHRYMYAGDGVGKFLRIPEPQRGYRPRTPE
jgi:hypothetical protein